MNPSRASRGLRSTTTGGPLRISPSSRRVPRARPRPAARIPVTPETSTSGEGSAIAVEPQRDTEAIRAPPQPGRPGSAITKSCTMERAVAIPVIRRASRKARASPSAEFRHLTVSGTSLATPAMTSPKTTVVPSCVASRGPRGVTSFPAVSVTMCPRMGRAPRGETALGG